MQAAPSSFSFTPPLVRLKWNFRGGEPLLNFSLIRWIVERTKERNLTENRDLRFVIATNLALLNDEILEFCKQHEILISTSLDGPPSLHNANRPRIGNDSHQKTIDGIRRVRNVLGGDAISALMTTTRASLVQPEAIIDEYIAQGFESVFLRPMSPYGFAIRSGAIESFSVDEWLVFYERALRYIVELNLNGTPFQEEYASLILRKALTPFPTSYVDLQSPSGIGISCLAFNYDGHIFASDESRMLAEMGDTSFRLGHLQTHSFEEVVTSDFLLETIGTTLTESMPMCSDCGFQPYCGSDPVYHWATQNDVVGIKPVSSFCHRNMEVMRLLFKLLHDDSDVARVLRSWAY
ncbi:MAG: His-Xaa-Ser system radical SAM maturase HxsB [Planctomycetaceae bacterium]|nr:His-Xaa-Ser system radical SAM maturase HxsB [Planctomycetaceae bacterium]